MKKVIVSVINDLTTDQRVHKICTSLQSFGLDVLLVGTKKKNSIPLERRYKTHRINTFFKKSITFYMEYNIRLFFFLFFKQKEILLSNDLDTLLPNYLLSKLQNKKLVYDSHELFTELPELIHKPFSKSIWLKIEKTILPKLKNTYTVCQSIADIYNNKYQTNFKVIRNIPVYQNQKSPPKKPKINKTIIYQGAINIGRGLELIIETIQYIDCNLIIVGGGEIEEKIQKLIIEKGVENKVNYLGKITPTALKKITPTADLGISIEEDLGLNYRFALPNKVFDYIHANIPVLVSDLPEMKQIVLDYEVGEIVQDRNPKKLAQQIESILRKEPSFFNENLNKASLDLQWQKEEKILTKIFSSLQ